MDSIFLFSRVSNKFTLFIILKSNRFIHSKFPFFFFCSLSMECVRLMTLELFLIYYLWIFENNIVHCNLCTQIAGDDDKKNNNEMFWVGLAQPATKTIHFLSIFLSALQSKNLRKVSFILSLHVPCLTWNCNPNKLIKGWLVKAITCYLSTWKSQLHKRYKQFDVSKVN